ncbi:MAG: DUF2997 domain-containing protein [Cyanobium sp.]
MSIPTTKTIEITVSPEGATSIKTTGFTGGSCRDATRDLERALGLAGRESLLPEFYARAQSGEQVQQGQ